VARFKECQGKADVSIISSLVRTVNLLVAVSYFLAEVSGQGELDKKRAELFVSAIRTIKTERNVSSHVG
jgi:hypothetical protein